MSSIDVNTLSESMRHFGTADYTVFVAMLLFSSLVGLYFGYKDHKTSKENKRNGIDDDTANYLVGGRNMQVIPVALSLVASFVSGITLLGTSTEIYLYGSQYSIFLIAIVIAAFIVHHTIIPVLHELEITSTYQYLEARFNRELRLYGSISYMMIQMMWLPIIIYVPALAFNQTTGVNIHIITPISMFICIVYTSIGGIKAVIWTDVLQITLMYGTLTLIAVKGTIAIGGLEVLIERNIKGERFEPVIFDLDPTIRHSFWTLVVGGSIWYLNINGINQSMVQRYLSLRTIKRAQIGAALFSAGVMLMISLCIYNGFVLFAMYHDCDPLKTKLAKAKDQLLPLLAIETLKDFPGLTGVFVAGVFSAALSSASTGLNSMAAVILVDFCGHFNLSKTQTAVILRGTVIVLGVIAVLLVYVVERLGTVLQLAMIIPSATNGPLLGVFFIGSLIPWIGGKATLWGVITGAVTMTSIIVKAQIESMRGKIKFPLKPVFTDGCTYNFTATNITSEVVETGSKHIYHMSYLYYTIFGTILVIIVSSLLSLVFGFQDPRKVDRRLVAPFMRKYIEFENQNVRNENLEYEATKKNLKIENFTTRQDFEKADEIDELKDFREKFQLPSDVIYFIGNSLGPCAVNTQEIISKFITDNWIKNSSSAEFHQTPLKVGEKIGKIIGAEKDETIVCDSTSVNIFKALGTALKIQKLKNPNRRVILLEKQNFPSDNYIVQGLVNFLSAENYKIEKFEDEKELEKILSTEITVLLLSHVSYRTGKLFDMKIITKMAHDFGVLIIWDLCHSVGAVPINLTESNVDFAVGCTYKYLNCGPGAPAFFYVNKRHQNVVWQPLAGWYGHEEPFKMKSNYEPARNIQQFLTGTGEIFHMSIVENSIEILLKADIKKMRKKSLLLGDLFINLLNEKCSSLKLLTPLEHEKRGSHLSFEHENAYNISVMINKRGICGNFRFPNILRFAMTSLYLRFVDIWDTVEIISDIVNNFEIYKNLAEKL
ncbi:hypothetical protein PVAND_014933 [Polypedilum vanderplanki]|uniref:Kynureninase n=1 Tax=Polypedilum vanderplanki TaxID=319348 RepID=A0A9J6BBI7_POLVA|nr:hypothetical protein PVAND_014933 [Polypedilum vanderplanki]